jgi:endonuclease/exonuclease/phosphatase (EEP) superfamily protein YafD
LEKPLVTDDSAPKPTTQPQKRLDCAVSSFRRLSVRLAGGLWLTGTLLWLTVRDQLPEVAWLFYGLPLPLLVFFGGWATAFLPTERRKMRIAWLVIVLIQVGCWLNSTVVFRGEQSPAESATLLFWNVCRGYGDYESVGAEISAINADVVALVEATEAGQNENLWRKVCPGYEVTRLGSGMMMLHRGKKFGWEFGAVAGDCRYQVLDLKIKEQRFTLIVIDVKSDPRFSKKPSFDRLEELITKYSDRPLLIVGDFNTPLESIYISRMRRRMQNSFEVSGSGFRDTWPVILPVLSLDQVWGNEYVRFHQTENGWSLRSDHRPIVSTFTTKAP